MMGGRQVELVKWQSQADVCRGHRMSETRRVVLCTNGVGSHEEGRGEEEGTECGRGSIR